MCEKIIYIYIIYKRQQCRTYNVVICTRVISAHICTDNGRRTAHTRIHIVCRTVYAVLSITA